MSDPITRPHRCFLELGPLNQRFLSLLLITAERGELELSPDIVAALQQQTERWQSTCSTLPFLLYRVTARNDNTAVPVAGWLDPVQDGVRELTTMTLGLIWQLCHDSPLLAAMISGMNQGDIAKISAQSLVELLSDAHRVGLQARLIDVPGYWQDLVQLQRASRLQKESLGPSGLQLILSRARQAKRRPVSTLLSRGLPRSRRVDAESPTSSALPVRY
ncbi:MAG: hypothetical protein AAF290_13120 [Pseudomonadota bacterium]